MMRMTQRKKEGDEIITTNIRTKEMTKNSYENDKKDRE